MSSPTVARDWYGSVYPSRAVAYMREFIALVRLCLSGESVTFSGEYFQLRKFRLGIEMDERRPKIVLGALRESMLRLGGEVADGVLLNYLPATYVPACLAQIRPGGNATVYANVPSVSATQKPRRRAPVTTCFLRGGRRLRQQLHRGRIRP